MTNLSTVDTSLLLVACFLFYKLVRSLSRRSKTTPLFGPARESIIFGASTVLREAPDASLFYEKWASQYGPVYSVPAPFGTSKTMLHDPKAITHFYAREGFGYNKTKLSREFIETLFGRGVLWAEGELHRRYATKALTPAFSNAAIRNLTSVFFDTAYKLTLKWNVILEGSPDGSQVIEVQKCLDSIGIAGFSHDFSALEDVPNVFDSMDFATGAVAFGLFIIFASQFPIVGKLPNQRMTMMRGLKGQLTKVADDLLKKGKEGGLAEDKSIIGMLLRTESDDSTFHMSREEIIAQMNVLLLAGYETTSSESSFIHRRWCLIELCRQQELQDRLREELSQFSTSDPTYEQLNTGLPYLDAIVHETLRTHPPVEESPRVAAEDDFIPLSSPMKTKTGETVTSLFIAKGSVVSTPIRALNRSEEVWGPDAKAFNPERWLAEDAQSKNFAITEFKAVLSVLIRNYRFEFDEGKTDMELGKFPSLLPRPKEIGAEGAYVPLRVTHV
ncbi:cytochrome P450 [Hymenopellis radicata]|nr:cytochrome P450 [Hymenopellis radicata]